MIAVWAKQQHFDSSSLHTSVGSNDYAGMILNLPRSQKALQERRNVKRASFNNLLNRQIFHVATSYKNNQVTPEGY